MKRKDRLAKKARRLNKTEREGARRGTCDLVAMQIPGVGSMGVGIRSGLYGSYGAVGIQIPHESLVGSLEDQQELGNNIIKIGLIAFAQLIGYNLAYGVDGLAKAACQWAGIDVEALKKEVAEPETPAQLELPFVMDEAKDFAEAAVEG